MKTIINMKEVDTLENSIQVENVFNTTVSNAWKALTDINEMRKWYFNLDEFLPQMGFEFKFLAGNDEKKYMHLCKVVEAAENKTISYSWRYEGYEGSTIVRFELIDLGDKTKITLKHTGVETLPKSNPDFARENFIGGWNYFIMEALKKYFDSREV